MQQQTARGVVGLVASAGGVEALRAFVAQLPADLDAAVLVVLHTLPTGPSLLPSILERAGPLPARHAVDGERITPGVVLVAPPDHHLLVEGDQVRLEVGPRVSGHRPSADLLLRTLAESWSTRAAGVVLSGTMDDGARGLRAIRRAGGLALVQDPHEATFPGMPTAAIEEARPVMVAPISALVEAVKSWLEHAGDPRPEHGPVEPLDPDGGEGDPATAFTCPDCGGTLFLDDDPGAERFRCRVGHSFSAEGLLAAKQDALEATLWAGVVALRERADLYARLAQRCGRQGMSARGDAYKRKEQSSRRQATELRDMLPVLVRSSSTEEAEEDGHGGTASER